jgi:hypothetical protein
MTHYKLKFLMIDNWHDGPWYSDKELALKKAKKIGDSVIYPVALVEVKETEIYRNETK